MPPHKQNRNYALEQQLMPKFQSRLEAQFAWKSAVSALMGLPALRAAWPMSAVGYQAPDQAQDITGGGNHLTDFNSANFGYDVLIPYVDFNGTTQYLSRASAVGNWATIEGDETFIVTAQQGLTFGGWFLIDTLDATAQFLIGKETGGGINRAYSIQILGTTDFPRISVATGAANHTATGTAGTTGAITTGAWNFIAGRYIPDAAAAELRIWVNNNSRAVDIGAVASINDVGADFTIGARDGPDLYMDGRASKCFLCACSAPNVTISQFYHQTRVMFGHV